MIICNRKKGHEKRISETLHNEIEYVLSIIGSNFNGENGSKFTHLLMVWADGADSTPLPPLMISLTVKYVFFNNSPIMDMKTQKLAFFVRYLINMYLGDGK